MSACCGMEWMAASPRLAPGTAHQILCNGEPLDRFPSGQSICGCKQFLQNLHPFACYGLINFTSLSSAAGDCGAFGCPAGYRVYTTGSSLHCDDPNFNFDSFTLYETACQSKWLISNERNILYNCGIVPRTPCINSFLTQLVPNDSLLAFHFSFLSPAHYLLYFSHQFH